LAAVRVLITGGAGFIVPGLEGVDLLVGDVRHVVAGPVRAESELGYSARVSFADGMREFATAPLRPAP
jgi:dTDP-L-rhamnose 4-epimerase